MLKLLFLKEPNARCKAKMHRVSSPRNNQLNRFLEGQHA